MNQVPKYFILDADGVFTDGKFHYSVDGKVMKVYGPDDGDALELLKEKLEIHVVSGDKRGFAITKKRIADDMHLSLDQVSTFERVKWIKEHFDPSATIYMGDGLLDPLVFKEVRYSIAPANAFSRTKAAADFVTNARGGEGAVAEAVLHILNKFFDGWDLHRHDFTAHGGVWARPDSPLHLRSGPEADALTRTQSLLTGGTNLEHLYTFTNFPVFIGCTNQPETSDQRADMTFDIDRDSGLIQLRNLLPPEVIYSDYHSEALGGVWARHHDAFSQFIGAYHPKNILELGGSNGALAQKLIDADPELKITMVEPNPAVKSTDRIKVIEGYFDNHFTSTETFDTLIHSHVLEHLYDPMAGLAHIRQFLPVGAKHIFSLPNLFRWLGQHFPNSLNFEHTVFLTEDVIDYLLAKHGFALIKKDYFEDHSIFFASQVVDQLPLPTLTNHYADYRELYQNFVRAYQTLVRDLNKKMQTFDGPIYLFGAHIFSQSLIEFGLNTGRIQGILDNSKLKQGQRLYGTPLKVFAPEAIKDLTQAAVILKVGAYRDEITQQLTELNPRILLWQ